jgi:D-alanyl-D-alanine carboxypeptidase
MKTMPEVPAEGGEKMPLSYGGNGAGRTLRIAALLVLLVLVLFAILRFHMWQTPPEMKQQLALVNRWNPVSEIGYTPKLTEIEAGFQADKQCTEAAKRMLADCRSAGCRPMILSAYRSVDDQLVLYDEEVQRLVNRGYSPELAEDEVSKKIAAPGRSEHELGLALDIVDEDFSETSDRQAQTDVSRWLKENAWRYGFILRYPEDAEEETGYAWHPWHYRYVGEGTAGNMHSLGITLEEYLSMFFSEEASVVYDEN